MDLSIEKSYIHLQIKSYDIMNDLYTILRANSSTYIYLYHILYLHIYNIFLNDFKQSILNSKTIIVMQNSSITLQ